MSNEHSTNNTFLESTVLVRPPVWRSLHLPLNADGSPDYARHVRGYDFSQDRTTGKSLLVVDPVIDTNISDIYGERRGAHFFYSPPALSTALQAASRACSSSDTTTPKYEFEKSMSASISDWESGPVSSTDRVISNVELISEYNENQQGKVLNAMTHLPTQLRVEYRTPYPPVLAWSLGFPECLGPAADDWEAEWLRPDGIKEVLRPVECGNSS